MGKKSVKEIKEEIKNLEIEHYIDYIESLRLDNRKAVQYLVMNMAKKLDKLRMEKERIERINKFELEAYNRGYMYIGGVDEAGRGPLAGPVVASVVVFDRNTRILGIDDSKKLSESKRDELFDIIKEKAIDYGIGIVNNKEIDEINILNATYEAMKRAINCLKNTPDCLLIDAVHIPGVEIYQNSIIKGDSKSMSIAASSILAKVTRDSIMYQYDKIYPEFGFKKHKGYGTEEHYKAIDKYGTTRIHRKSFLKKYFK